MTVIVKNAGELVVPRSIRRQAGIKSGDRLEFRVSGGVINIVHKSAATTRIAADNEYTPAQRRKLDAELRSARKGPFHGPFDTADAMIAHMETALKKRSASRKTSRRKTSQRSR